MNVPLRATYRLQFHAGFTLDDAAAIVPDLARLGISHLYASPLQASRRGSTHGYDGVDPGRIDGEVGGLDALLRLAATLRRHGLGLVMDIVPNHLAISPENAWWMSVLAEGPASPHAAAFDIDWDRGGGRVILPVLADPYGDVLQRGDITVERDAGSGRAVARYFDARFPLRDGSLPAAGLDAGLPPARLHDVLEAQHWRLAWWRLGPDAINYRRFFEVDQLIGVRVERADVFEAVHALVIDLVRRGVVQGLRIDHVDGLVDPEAYLRRLRKRVGPGVTIHVEKILGAHEDLRPWPVEGTTGYEVLNWLDGLLVPRAGLVELRQAYAEATGDTAGMDEHLDRAKRTLLRRAFATDREAIVDDLAALASRSIRHRDLSRPALGEALDDLIVAFDVYRSYRTTGEPSPEDRALIGRALARAVERTQAPDPAAHAFIGEILLSALHDSGAEAAMRRLIVIRIQQLSGPVMAKSLEDTAFYRSAPLLALNEVGAPPDSDGLDPDAVHGLLARRRAAWPRALVATTTHDTKRSEDARARLLMLGHEAERWRETLHGFLAATEGWTAPHPDGPAPDGVDRAILLQALLASWPLDALEDAAGPAWLGFGERLGAYALKAVREAKRRTAWTRQDEAYEQAVSAFVERLVQPGEPVIATLLPLARILAARGATASIVRTVLKLTVPGVPDTYQGTELWDVSMVDPDNRRPVDPSRRRTALADEASMAALAARWPDGHVKARVTRLLLADRAAWPALYDAGEYEPLAVPQGSGLFGFTRRGGGQERVVLARVGQPGTLGGALETTGETPGLPEGRWRDILTDRTVGDRQDGSMFDCLPAVVLARNA